MKDSQDASYMPHLSKHEKFIENPLDLAKTAR